LFPYMNFTITQFKNANTQKVLLSRVNTQSTKSLSVSLDVKAKIIIKIRTHKKTELMGLKM